MPIPDRRLRWSLVFSTAYNHGLFNDMMKEKAKSSDLSSRYGCMCLHGCFLRVAMVAVITEPFSLVVSVSS